MTLCSLFLTCFLKHLGELANRLTSMTTIEDQEAVLKRLQRSSLEDLKDGFEAALVNGELPDPQAVCEAHGWTPDEFVAAYLK
jgi:hypothetical protein